MFDSKKEITKAVDSLYAVAEKLNRGDTLTHERIGRLLRLAPHEGRWGLIVGRVRRRLEQERGISTWVIERTVGYKLLTHAEQLELPSWRTRRAIRQMRRGRKSLTALPEQGLSLHQRRSRLFVLDRLKETERNMRRELRAQREQLKPTPTMPRRPAPPERADHAVARA